MERYEKPVVLDNEELAEGVYASSGVSSDSGTVKCESVYMNWVWQAATYDWSNGTPGYKYNYGCLGCRAYRSNGCGLLTDYVESGYASSYESDIGYYQPTWERKGYGPDDPVTDFDCG
ncbi:MAG: hypothetical protein LUE16_00305 [Lachnospiraceae bacterium]|nr:hypothetical protein [Lachnospiraceae bacterium]